MLEESLDFISDNEELRARNVTGMWRDVESGGSVKCNASSLSTLVALEPSGRFWKIDLPSVLALLLSSILRTAYGSFQLFYCSHAFYCSTFTIRLLFRM
jgi:hypothetical protein